MATMRLVHSSPGGQDALSARSDDELMRLAQAGSRDAFAVLVERHARRLVNLCSRFVRAPHLGQELAQDTWVMVWQKRGSYNCQGGFVAWLFTIARNHCRNHLRRGSVAAKYDSGAASLAPTSPGQIEQLLLDERRRQVRSALSELPEAMREALLLRYGEELRYDEMTTVVGTGESTLRSRVYHGLKQLRARLENDS